MTDNNPIIYFKYHDGDIDEDTYNYVNLLVDSAIDNVNAQYKTCKFPNYEKYNSDIIVNSNLITDKPEIISAGGFSLLQTAIAINKENVRESEGNWNNDLNMDDVISRAITTTGDPRNYYSSIFPTTAQNFDNIPVCFSFPILPNFKNV
jgi:hypothetical protein